MTEREHRFIVGLTGGIGSGKSAATQHFAFLGAAVIDTDEIAHELTAPGGQAIEAIRKVFGDEVITDENALDRAAMRECAFTDPNARRQLEDILHPIIRATAMQRCAAAEAAYVVLAVPLLLESKYWLEQCDRVCVVDCPEELQISRTKARSGLEETQIRAIMAAQTSRNVRLSAADDIIDNSGTLQQLRSQVERLHEVYLVQARRN